MFFRLLWKLLQGSRGRLAVALIAVISGSAVISGLLDLQFDVQSKLTQEFRTLGANLVISLRSGEPSTDDSRLAAGMSQLMDQATVTAAIENTQSDNVVGAAPFLYVIARAKDIPAVVTGTWLNQLLKLNPTWKIDGQWPRSQTDESDCLIGRNVAAQFQLTKGESIVLDYQGRSAQFRVSGVIDAGSAEDNQVFVNLAAAQKLAGSTGQIELAQLSVRGTPASIGAYAARLAAGLPGYNVQPIRQVTQAEGNLLHRTRLLITSMVILILVLTALCVLATMAALAMERRKDVGLMKALGGSIGRIVSLFLAEVGVLGAAGALIGCVAGVALARWMGERVFSASINPQWEVFPLTIVMMLVASMAGALPLQRLGRVKPAVILRGE